MNNSYAAFPQKWRDRFAFFEAHGAPNTESCKAAVKALPSFGEKMKIGFNWLAWLFGPIYFAVLGMWRKALVGLAITIAVGVLACFLPDKVGDGVTRGFGIAMSLVWGRLANYAYYLKQMKGENGWNLFEGIGL